MAPVQHIAASRRRIVWQPLLAVLAAFTVMSAYLFFSRWPSRWFTANTDYAALAVSVLAFIACLATLPVRAGIRIAAMLILAPILYCILTVCSLLFVGVVFQDWL